MQDLMANPAFTTFAACTAILVIKNFLSAANTAVTRVRAAKFVNPEDASLFKAGDPVDRDVPSVVRALRIQGNDSENLPAFFAIGLVFVLTGASAFEAAAYFWTFTIARILHTIVFTLGVQPWRGLAFSIGALCLVGMSVQVLMAAF